MNDQDRRRLLRSKIEDSVLSIKIRTPFDSTERLQGLFRSVFKNRGIERADSRPYQFGDDIRDLDIRLTMRKAVPILLSEPAKGLSWGRSAALENLFLKQNTEERQNSMILVSDLGPSMLFGFESLLRGEGSLVRTKAHAALKLFFFLGYNAVKSHFNVGYDIVRDEELFNFRKPSHSFANVELGWRLMMDYFIAGQRFARTRHRLRRSLEELNLLLKYRTIVAVISDFDYDQAELRALADLLVVMQQKHFLVPCWLRDDDEIPDAVLAGSGREARSAVRILEPSESAFYYSGRGADELKRKREEHRESVVRILESGGCHPLAITANADEETKEFARKIEDYFNTYASMI